MPVRRPAPDPGVIAAVESCQSNTRMKRMVMFGLRALSELCTPPRGRYLENALDAVSRGITASLGEVATNMANDEEVMELVAKVCWGIAQGLQEYGDSALLQRFVAEGGPAVAAAAVNGIGKEPDAITMTFGMLEALSNIGIVIDASSVAPGMIRALDTPDLPLAGCLKVALAIGAVANISASEAAALGNAGAVEALVTFATTHAQSSDPVALDTVFHALVAAGNISKACGGNSANVTATKNLIEKNKGRKRIMDAGCQALSGMLSLEQLAAALEALNSPSGSPERANALELLSAMSYVPQFADAIVESGSVALLVQAINSTQEDLAAGNRDEALMMGLVGTASLLGRISRISSHTAQVYDAGGLSAIATALSNVTDDQSGDAFSACCSALAALAAVEEYARELYNAYGITGVTLTTLYNRADVEPIQESALELLAAMSHHEVIRPPLIDESAVEIISYSMQYAPQNFAAQMFALRTLEALTPLVYTTAAVYEYGGFQGLAQSLSINVAAEDFSLKGVRVLATLANVSDSKSYMAEASVVDCVLYTMLEHSANPVIAETGLEVLESIATTQDAERHVRTLDAALGNAATDSQGALKALAAACGLSRVKRLAATFEQADVAGRILKHMKILIENPQSLATIVVGSGAQKMTLQEKLLRASMLAVETMSLAGSGSLDNTLPPAIATVASDKLKSLGRGENNTPEFVFRSLCRMAAADRMTEKQAVESAIGHTMSCFTKFSDFRSLSEVILEILYHLASAQGGVGVSNLVERGGCKLVLDFLKKTPYSLKAQVNGLRIVGVILHNNSDYVEALRSCGTVDIINTALRTHQRSNELREVVAPIIAHLIPAEELREIVGRNISIMRDSIDAMDFKRMLAAMKMLADIGVCAEGAKALARQGAAREIRRVGELDIPDSDKIEVHSGLAHVASLMSAQRVGQTALVGDSVQNTLLKLVQDLSDAGEEEGILHCLQALGRVLQGDPGSVTATTKRQIISIVTKILQDYPSHASIVPAAAKVLGALSRSDDDAAALSSEAEVANMVDRFNTDIQIATKTETVNTLTKATADLVHFSNPTLCTFVASRGTVVTLVNTLENNAADRSIVRNAAEALDRIGKNKFVNLRDFWESQGEGAAPDIKHICRVFKRCVEQHIDDRDAVITLVKAFAKFPREGEGLLLKEAGIFDMVRELVGIYPDEEDLEVGCAELVENIAPEDLVQFYMQQLLTADAAGDMKSLDDAMENLNVLLLSPLPNSDVSLANEENVWEVLARRLQPARDAQDLKTMRNIMITAQRLVDQGKGNVNGYRGAWNFSQHLLPSCVDMIDTGGPPMQTKRLVTAMMQAISGAVSNPNTRQLCIETLPISKLMDMLEANLGDPDITAAITNVLYNIGMDDVGIEKIKGQRRDIVPLLATVMRTHRGRAKVIVPATGLLANLSKPGVGATSPSLTGGDALLATDRATGGGAEFQSPLDANMMGVFQEAIKNPEVASVVKSNGHLIKTLRRLDGSEPSPSSTTTRRLDGADSPETMNLRNHFALANMLEAYGVAGEGPHVREHGGVTKLAEMLEEYNDVPEIYTASINALSALAATDKEGAGHVLATSAIPRSFPWVGPTGSECYIGDEPAPQEPGKLHIFPLNDDGYPTLASTFCIMNMLEAARQRGGPIAEEGDDIEEFLKRRRVIDIISQCEFVASNNGDEDLVNRIRALQQDQQPEPTAGSLEGMEMKIGAPTMEADIDPEDPNALTLKQVHDWLKERLDNNETIDVNDSSEPLLFERFTFVFSKMTDYNSLQLVYNDFAGYQSQWGCKAWDLWITYTPDILPTVLEWGIHSLMIDYIKQQTLQISSSGENEVVIATPPSATLATIGSIRDPGAVTLASIPDIAPICTRNINLCVDDPKANTDEHIIPRTAIVEAAAIDRTIFTDPAIVHALLRAWDQYDAGIYTTLALRHIFRALRRIVCDNHTEAIIEANVTQRLITELKKDFDNPLLIDGFFLLGVLSVDNRLKTIIGEQNGIEESLIILRNHMEDPPGEGVITNSQLALANLVVGHRKNCNSFYRNGGLQLNVRVLNERGEHFDETNAASALLTNACFRREDIKAAYGTPEIGAPSSLSYAIACYDGGTDPAALRCLSNLFKAISNMSLYTPNVDLFLESGLENAYYNLLAQSQGLPDDVVKTGLFTLSNLTWENKTSNMVKFGIIIPPLIDMASQGGREDTLLLGSSLETLAFLCRLPANAQTFAEYGGIRLAMTLLQNHGPASTYVLQQAVSCLGVAARQRENAPYLLQENCLPVLKNVLEGAYFQETDTQSAQLEVALTTLRVIRRVMIAGGAETAGVLGETGGTATLVWYLESLAAMEDPLVQLALEGIRAILAALALGQGDDPDQYMTIEDTLDMLETGSTTPKKKSWFGRKQAPGESEADVDVLQKPEGPRGYEVISLDVAGLASVTDSVLRLMQVEALQKHLRFMRTALGWMAYLAAENVPGATKLLIEHAEQIGAILRLAFEELGMSPELVLLTMNVFGCLGYHNGSQFALAYGKDSVAYKTAVELGKKVQTKDKAEKERLRKLKDRYDEFLLAWKAVANGDNGETCFRKFASYDTDFSITQWYRDPYPNGVHDLLIKEELRTGGRLKVIVDEKTRDSFFWRANQTLALFQWRIEKDKNVETEGKPILEFNAGVPVSKISCIVKGLGNEILRKAAKKQRGLSHDLCFALQGPATEDFPNGFDFGIKCKTKAERDQFVSWMLDWREACSA